MKQPLLYTSIIFIVLLFSCKKEEVVKPKVIYENPSKTTSIIETENALVEIADLPILMEGTNILIHPIGVASSTKATKTAYESEMSFSISNYGEYQITGYLKNLKFQEIGKDTLVALTDKSVLIETATYLKAFADKSKKQLMVYTLVDMDTNKDGKLDDNDIKALYMSTITGQDFVKLSADFNEVVDWKMIESKNLLFFRTKEDTNKNGQFDNTDSLQYHYIDLSDNNGQVIDYKPV